MPRAFAWLSVLALAALPWVALRMPALAPAVAVAGVTAAAPWRRRAGADPGGSLVEAGSAAAAAWTASPDVAAGWVALALVVALSGWAARRRGSSRPDVADLVALVGWGGAVALRPELAATPAGWLAPLVLLAAARRVVLRPGTRVPGAVLGPPAREVEGRLELRGLVAVSEDGLPALPPLDLLLEPGHTAALLWDEPSALEPLVAAVSGRRRPAAGVVTVDGVPVEAARPVVAVVAPGEPFVAGTLEENLAVLADGLEPAGLLAVREACGLDAVEAELDGRELDAAGVPLGRTGRLLVLAARVLLSPYRVVVVLDPVPWVNAVRGEVWRRAVVRASVGRTALWVTGDRELARRAHRIVTLRAGVWQEEDR